MNDLIFRASKEIVVRSELEAALAEGRKLRIKFGIDPTGERIHLGHAATIRKLKHFQAAGHQIVLIVGSFTGRIGDASDKDSERQILTAEAVERNMQRYEVQLGRIFDISAAEIHYNHEWFNQMGLDEWLRINQLFSVAQMIERDNFAQRFKAGSRIGLQEFQYPLLQGYDSVAVRADVEIGGTDQLFNLLAGRPLQKAYKQAPQHAITYELLLADDGRKMSKSWANCIWIDDEPAEMYGKLMRINDELVMHYFELCTDVPVAELDELKTALESGNPRDVKARLAREVVAIYHDEAAADHAAAAFMRQFSQGELPENIPEVQLDHASWEVEALLLATKLADSKSAARRLLAQGGVRLNGEKLTSTTVNVTPGDVLQAGKRRFVRLILS
ncbi:MAG: tyrosine--tRNA ligase [Candidatus Saccharimonadales bacterium]